MQRFMEHEGIDKNMSLRVLNKSFTQRLSIYLKTELNLKNKSHNNIITVFHSVIATLIKLDENLFAKNPTKVDKLKVTSHTHAAYTQAQLKQFTEAINDNDAQLLLFIRFIYFTLARPKELKFLKISHIRMDVKRILIVGENAKTNIEQYVGIAPVFEKMIIDSGILNYPPDYYVFTANGKPGMKPVGHNYFYKRFRPYMDALNFKKINDRYIQTQRCDTIIHGHQRY